MEDPSTISPASLPSRDQQTETTSAATPPGTPPDTPQTTLGQTQNLTVDQGSNTCTAPPETPTATALRHRLHLSISGSTSDTMHTQRLPHHVTASVFQTWAFPMPTSAQLFFFERKKDKISASTTANHWCRSAPRTALNKGTSPSAPGGTRPRRDNAKEFATTHPNMERHLRDHAAAAFPLRMSGFRGNKTSQKLVCLSREPPPHFGCDHHEACTSPVTSQLWVLALLRSSCFVQSNTITVCCMAPGGPIRPDGGHQGGVDCQLGASPQRESVSDDFQSPTIQMVERTKVEVAHHDVGTDPGASLAANSCHHGLHRKATVAQDSRPRTRRPVVTTAIEWTATPVPACREGNSKAKTAEKEQPEGLRCEGGLPERGQTSEWDGSEGTTLRAQEPPPARPREGAILLPRKLCARQQQHPSVVQNVAGMGPLPQLGLDWVFP